MKRAAQIRRRAKALDTGRGIREALLIISLTLIYMAVRGAAAGDADTAMAHARDVIRWEQALGIYWEREIQRAFLGYPALSEAANWFYWIAHFPLLLLLAVWAYRFNADRYPLLRNAFVISAVIGMAVFYLWPLAPPRLLPPDYGFVDPAEDSVLTYRGLGLFVNHYAAMPSMHFAWAAFMAAAFVWLSSAAAVRLAALLIPPVNLWSIIVTANHFILDAAAGLAVMAVALVLALILPVAVGRVAFAAGRLMRRANQRVGEG